MIEETIESKTDFLSIPVGMDDPTTNQRDGDLQGNHIDVRIWTGEKEHEVNHSNWIFEAQGTTIMELDVRTIPENYRLHANYPNPFNPTTTVSYDLSMAGEVSLVVYNILGEIVHTMVSEYQEPGLYHVTWDAINNAGNEVSSGVYFFKLQSGDFMQINKAILLK